MLAILLFVNLKCLKKLPPLYNDAAFIYDDNGGGGGDDDDGDDDDDGE